MTSNIGSHELMSGVSRDGTIPEGVRRGVLAQLCTAFRPEFLNRVDEVVLFSPLTAAEVEKIVEIQLRDLRKRLEERFIQLELSPEAVHHIAVTAYDPVFGARPVKRHIQKHVETELGRKIIKGEVPDGSTVRLVLSGDRLDFEVIPPAAPREPAGVEEKAGSHR
jgi:ATP-dependent Clp protease ATP-binding subunit ClpB